MAKQILTQLSSQTIYLGTGNDQFEVTVHNLSDCFATFALELSASGLDRQASPDWYRLTPDLSAKIPAGDRVKFVVDILEVPPIPGGFTGKMNLNVHVTCLELGEEDRQLVNLVVPGSGALPPVLQVTKTAFQTVPGTLVEIPFQIYNPNRSTVNLRIALKGLPYVWLTDGQERRLQVPSQGTVHVLFICQPPLSSEALSQVYPFDIEVSQAEAPTVYQSGTLDILPTGWIDFGCTAAPLTPESLATGPASTRYTLELSNRSNVDQTVALTLARIDVPWSERLRAVLRRQPPKPAPTTSHVLQLSPAQVALKAGDIEQSSLTLQPQPPWLGWRRRQQFQLRPQLQQTEVRPPTHTVELIAAPKIPVWVQGLGIAALALGTILPGYWQAGHRGPVNSVQFDGQANTLVSAADDHTIHRWQVSRNLRDVETLKDTNKAIRVVRYRPLNNDWLAAGLENGEIQLWDLLSSRSPKTLVYQRADRVFDLQFSQDSQSLFSAHGSGDVLRWPLTDIAEPGQPTLPDQQHQFGFAIQAITLVGPAETTLAVGGRFNRLVLWDFEQDQQHSIDYPAGNPNQYLTSLTTAGNRPDRLATADNQGRITLWDLSRCLSSSEPCDRTDQWTDGHRGEPVNAVALSKNACYLVSGGDDGRVMLWALNLTGQVMAQHQIARSRQPINSVDLVQQGQNLLIASGDNHHHVRLYRAKDNNPACP
ncbi:WD40 repeat domain-containing protein [Romeria aff. gracilis LEGE 07310]|uniref:WD40 repeat domain-containing protein n=1 Tax=Vasconcelosia minhoensis LEGE 07310 TaxID=915328 RepID=A0A8J7ASX8_9CYAN|nr:WD40 repeat domain-containing protein [Romeria gracilis]MBE9080236.1 WD40 repeat domain-containing protein [Romeria aff. gracilis LEGE 07310]